MELIGVISVISGLFILIGLSEPLAARLRLPYSVILAGMGILVGAGASYMLSTDLTDVLNPVAEAILGLPIHSYVFLYIFLPTLLFQVSLGLNLRRMLDDWVPILLLAVVAVIVATFTIGFALQPVSGLPLTACLLIGAIVSTTDPSAVVSIFRDIAAPQRLSRIVEGESLLNDAAAIALFGLFLTFVMAGVPDPTLGAAVGQFPFLILGGAGTGYLVARAGVMLVALVGRHRLAQVSITVAIPYLTYIVTERLLGASGVTAVVVSGLTMNLLGPGRLSPVTWTYLREVWDLLAHWAGSLIFVLAALLIPRFLSGMDLTDLGLVLVVVAAAVVARALMLWVLLPLMTLLRLSPRVDPPYRLAILWGGLRGAVTLALALAVTENALVEPEVKRAVGILATGFTLFTLVFQGTTLRWMIRRIGLDRLSPIDLALSNQVIAVALQNVREDATEAARDHGLTHDIVRSEAKSFGDRLERAVREAEAGAEILDRDRITLGLVALAGRERDLILEQFNQQVISARLVDRMLSDVDRLIERTRGGRSQYRLAARRALVYNPGYRLAVMLHNRLRLSRPLAAITADRFEILVHQQFILRDLHGFISAKILRIHGKRVAELLHEVLERREEEVSRALEGLRLQYPGYAEQLERVFIRRTVLRMEEREYAALLADGLVGFEVHAKLMAELARSRARVEVRPRLDITLHKPSLVSQFPLFQNMEEQHRVKLARALVTVFAAPGKVIIRKGDVARSVYFIASGAVEVEFAGQKQRLGRGQMFGQLGLLAKRRRRAQVTAITPCTLLSLDDSRFRRLLERNPSLREAVEASQAGSPGVMRPPTLPVLPEEPAPESTDVAGAATATEADFAAATGPAEETTAEATLPRTGGAASG
ncbi:cyclic nucleotide-binding domain-containing protein (plasmid) [Paroceanicella profunda]|uniref:Cyclic nucleotide-binding domain-containing protein n=1 Tax=Paroceanicella profunda TaxID=2579971 RepID=A0A5B8G146_9RHOB|nr:cation:proton antiporter [Paroceanicella profunda]QDL94435.1 cyclic nucleotide-binding domain-containing protein [Paroceanicella profunda]